MNCLNKCYRSKKNSNDGHEKIKNNNNIIEFKLKLKIKHS